MPLFFGKVYPTLLLILIIFLKVIVTSHFRHNKKWQWLGKDFEKRIKSAKNSDDMIELYKELSAAVKAEKDGSKTHKVERSRHDM